LREVGIHIGRAYRGHHYASDALAALRERYPGHLLANVNPLNLASIAFFERHGAKLIQSTYEL
ncbi:MAG TPA: GNAT family N-acetyltransferase, partial [Xanthobacteraceae bacterium]|nr:GNAT family N-acetyltransferase [Xanthobacteraceae bacterium]